MSSKKRLEPKIRKERILRAAIEVAQDIGFHKLTRERVAEQADVTVSLINHYYSTMNKLQRAVMRFAVHTEMLSIIRYGIAVGNKQALKAPPDVLQKARNL